MLRIQAAPWSGRTISTENSCGRLTDRACGRSGEKMILRRLQPRRCAPRRGGACRIEEGGGTMNLLGFTKEGEG